MNEFPREMQVDLQPAWNAYVDFLTPYRSDLHRYCRKLTGNVWDGEDLVQDTVVRVFAQLGARWDGISSPRAYLARTATHLWIDRLRRLERERRVLAVEASTPAESPAVISGREVEDAAARLVVRLAPRERAAILMKDVFDFSLEETATLLRTTVGAVKAALHRGRARLDEDDAAAPARFPSPPREIVEEFTAAFNARDMEALSRLVSADCTVELVGGNVMHGSDDNAGFFSHALMPFPGDERGPRFEIVDHLGEPVVVGFRFWKGVEGVNDVSRLEVDGEGRISLIRCYCWCPETLAVIGGQIAMPSNPRPYRSPTIEEFQELFAGVAGK